MAKSPDYFRDYYRKHREIIKARSATARKEQPEKTRRAVRNSHYRDRYGFDENEKQARIARQDYKCAICGSKEPGGNGQWHTDHNHDTGQLRSELCAGCNTTLGFVKEDPAILREMIAYLRHWELQWQAR